MSALDILITKNPNLLNLVRRFDLVEIQATKLKPVQEDNLSSKISTRVRSLISSLKDQYP